MDKFGTLKLARYYISILKVLNAEPDIMHGGDMARVKCDQCEAAMINRMFCHETGCPNARKRYDLRAECWIAQRKCYECGCMVDADTDCCSDTMELHEY